MSQNQDIESVLISAYRQQAVAYGRALTLAEEMLAGWHELADVDCAMQRLVDAVAEVVSHNSKVEKTRQQWLDSGRKPGPVLGALLQHVTGLIERLRNRVAELEHLAVQRKQALTPQMDNLARGSRMQRAYAATKSSFGF